MRANEELVGYLSSTRYLTSTTIKKAFLKVDRKFFVPEKYLDSAYADQPLPIGSGQTISAPSVVSFMLEKLSVKKGMKILELGTGSGYNTALLAELVGSEGKIITVERISGLAELAKSNIKNCVKGNKEYDNIDFIVGDGTKGYELDKPYDRIIATASLPYLDSSHPLISQLKEDGILIAPVGERYWQDITVYKKKFNSFEKVLPVMFVPLIGAFGFEI